MKETPEISLVNQKNMIINPDFSNQKDGPSYIQRRDQELKDDLAHIEEVEQRDPYKSPDFEPQQE